MQRNPWLCLVIAGTIGLTVLACVGGIIAASVTGHEPHSSLTTIAATCVGALASFLVVPPRSQVGVGGPNPPQPPTPGLPLAVVTPQQQQPAGTVRTAA